MTHAPIRSFCATTAICAVLALGSTSPAWAQDASAPVSTAPTITLPAPAPAAQPTIVLPEAAPAPAAPAAAPVVQQVPAAAPATAVADEPAPARSTTPRTSTKAPAAARTAQAARTAAPETPIAAPAPRAANTIPPVAAPPLAQPAVTPPSPAPAVAPAASDTTTGLTTTAWIAGILAALGFGTAGVLALRSRRRDEEEDYEEAYYEEAHRAASTRLYADGPTMAPAMPVNEPTGGLEPELPMPAYTTVAETIAEPAKAIEPTPHPSVAQKIGTEELVPDNREERDALLEQMVAAEPDAENPFTSRKGRMRRARLILQAREHEQKQNEAQPFDWRTYQPSTSNPAPATPPRVTV